MKPQRESFLVHASVTVSAACNGRRLTNTTRGSAIRVKATSHEHALKIAERELGAQLLARYGSKGGK